MTDLLAHLSTTVAALLQRHFQTSVPPDSSLPLVLAMAGVVLTFSVPSLIWSLVCGLCCRCRKSHKKTKSIVASGSSALTYDAFENVGVPFFLVDAFASRSFGGNNAAIVILDSDPSKMENENWLQKVAQETLQPMTAFLLRRDKTNYTIRWFTPDHENKLCGHASLGAAHVLFSTGAVPSNVSLSFHSHLAGVLSTTCVTQFGGSTLQGRCQLGFPASQITHKFPVSEALQEGLDIKAAVGLETEDVSYLGSNGTLLLIEVREAHMLNLIIPEEKVLREWATRGVVITAPLKPNQTVDSVFNNGIDTPVDFVSRVFYVTKGRVSEDPVTGSAHCLLATHYHERTKKTSFVAYQASERGGLLELHLVEGKTRVRIAGDATTIMQGRLIA